MTVQNQWSIQLPDLFQHQLVGDILLQVLRERDFLSRDLLSMRYASDAFGYLLDLHLDDRILEILALLIYLGL